MVQQSKREYLAKIKERYRHANRKYKSRILDEFCAVCGHHRKHAIRLLRQSVKPSRKDKRGRSKVYQGQVVIALTKIWVICGQICSRWFPGRASR